MARLPSALKRRNEDADLAMRLRRENLARLRAGQAPRATPEPAAPVVELQAAQEAGRPVEQAEAAGPQPRLEQRLEQAAADPDEVERLRNRASTSEGMLRAENERHRQAEESWRRREAELLQRMLAVQQQAPAAPLSLEELRRYVTPQQLLELGEEHCRLLVAAVRSTAGAVTRGAVQEEVAAVREELAQQRLQMQRSREAAFWAAIDGALPRWREVNANADFLQWLKERDAIAGRSRQEALNEARAALDADRVVAIFNAWNQAQPRPTARDPSRRVIPNGKPSSSQPLESATDFVTRAEMAEHNRRLSQDRRYRGSEAATKMQQRFDRAASEGRIR